MPPLLQPGDTVGPSEGPPAPTQSPTHGLIQPLSPLGQACSFCGVESLGVKGDE